MRVKLTGDGTNIGKHLHVVNFGFTIIDEGDLAYSAAGNHCIAIFMQTEDYASLKAALRDVNTSTFTNNVGSLMHLSACDMKLSGNVLFKNNTAENGGVMYLKQGTTITIDDEASVQFIGNTATLNGGAIYVDLLCEPF